MCPVSYQNLESQWNCGQQVTHGIVCQVEEKERDCESQKLKEAYISGRMERSTMTNVTKCK